MTPERWQQVKQVLATALEVAPDERARFLDQSCAGDDSLRDEVEQLLGDEQMTQDFLNHTGLATAAAALLPGYGNPWVGRRVGPYKITQQIGAGGMGEVYRAVRADDQYQKEVALKVVRSGQDSGFIVDRFKNERQILASLEHPNIARLLDGGTTEDGTPYFVMELIEGQPITEYCDRRNLSVTERLELFSKVCAALQYAHQHLIIHRDIKPGNILVTLEGTPKLLDFGIAKIMGLDGGSPELDATQTAFRILTPRYASPEQIKGEPMTTASDVYSLGVVLYELLAARSPYGPATSNATELARAVCDDEPERPSVAVYRSAVKHPGVRGAVSEKRVKQLRGDLDNIVLMALRKEPARRYQSVEQFAEDVRRHLEDVPVAARNDTTWYRTSKFVSRHRVGAIGSAVATLALVGGLAVALYEARAARQQAEIARVQRVRAERRFNDVRKLANSLMFEIHDSIKDLPGTTPARKLLVNRALEYLDSLSQEAGDDISLQRELAAAYDRVGDVLGYNGAANLGDYAGAMQNYKKALAIRESAAASRPDDPQIRGELLNDYFRLSFALQSAGDYPGALEDLRKGLPLAQKFVATSNDAKYQEWLAGFYWQAGNVLRQAGDYAQALENFRQSASIRERIATGPNANPTVRMHLSGDYFGLGQMQFRTGDLSHGMENSRKGLQILESLSAADPTNATLHEYLGEAYENISPLLEKQGDLDQALNYNNKAREIYEKLVSADPTNALALDNFGCAEMAIGHELLLQKKIREAFPHLRKAISLFEGIESKNHYAIAGQAESYSAMGNAYAGLTQENVSSSDKAKNLREAEVWYRKSLNTWEQAKDHGAVDPLGGDDTKDRVAQKLAKCEIALQELKEKNIVSPTAQR